MALLKNKFDKKILVLASFRFLNDTKLKQKMGDLRLTMTDESDFEKVRNEVLFIMLETYL